MIFQYKVLGIELLSCQIATDTDKRPRKQILALRSACKLDQYHITLMNEPYANSIFALGTFLFNNSPFKTIQAHYLQTKGDLTFLNS